MVFHRSIPRIDHVATNRGNDVNTKDISVTANEVRAGDRIIMRPTWPEGRLVVDVSHGPRDFQLRFTFEGDDEACAFYRTHELVVVRV
ncbi:hypothetical protein WK03_35725 [Burkholderia cepacia]|nr:hypothetical protein WK03_35725 [Burkholderia cepacia]